MSWLFRSRVLARWPERLSSLFCLPSCGISSENRNRNSATEPDSDGCSAGCFRKFYLLA